MLLKIIDDDEIMVSVMANKKNKKKFGIAGKTGKQKVCLSGMRKAAQQETL